MSLLQNLLFRPLGEFLKDYGTLAAWTIALLILVPVFAKAFRKLMRDKYTREETGKLTIRNLRIRVGESDRG